MDLLDVPATVTAGPVVPANVAAPSAAPVDSLPANPAPAGAASDAPTVLSPATATPRQRTAGIAMMLGSSVSGQAGAALGASAFPLVGTVGVVAVRQLVTAAVLVPTVRPRVRGLRRDQWLPVLGLVAVFSVMNLSLYLAVERIGLGLAVTIEFLGPLAVAIVGSRRAGDLACAVLAGVGVVVLTNPGPTTDVAGVLLAATAAVAWACYILLNRNLGQRLPGLEGPALSSAVTAAVWLPVAVWWFSTHPLHAGGLALAAACALLSSVVPYVADVLALRRVPAATFGTFASVNPVWAALAGWLVLGQGLDAHEGLGIALVVVSNVVVSARGLRRARAQAAARTAAAARTLTVARDPARTAPAREDAPPAA